MAAETKSPAPGSDDGAGNANIKAAAPAPTYSTPPERQPSAKDFFRVFAFARGGDWLLMLTAAVSSVGAGVTMPLMNVVLGKLVGNFSMFNGADGGNSFEKDINKMSLYIFILFLVRFALNYVSKFSFRMISARMSAAIRLHYLRCLFSQTIHVLDSMPSGAAANTITSTANTLQLGISENLGTFVEFVTCIVASIVIAFTYSWLLTLAISSIMVYIILVVSVSLPFITKAETELSRAEVVANAVAAESFSNIRMLMACGAESKMGRKYSVWVQKAQSCGQRTAPFFACLFGNVFFAVCGGFALAFWFGLKLLHEGRIDNVSNVIIVVMSIVTIIVSLERVGTPLIAASKAMVAASEFFTIIDAPRPDPGRITSPDVSTTEDIVFTGVDFAYPGRPHVKVLDGLNIRIEAGKVNAIVGPSGSGKSTIVGLVERWYSLQNEQYVIEHVLKKDGNAELDKAAREKQQKKDDKEKKRAAKKRRILGSNEGSKEDSADATGEVLQNADASAPDLPRVELKGSVTTCGRNLDDINIKWWRSQIGLVQQEPFLFNDSIFNNVAFGLVGSDFEDASDNEKRSLVETACEEAFADEFINRLPDGYQTRVGESGTKLSGGQRQRIAIARSIVKKPKILIFDEATSAIDVRSERIVQAALDKVSLNRTTITVAHRLSTIKSADNIIVLYKGKCVEEGTHETLLADRDGVYHRLVNAQQLSLGENGHGTAGDASEEIEAEADSGRETSAANHDDGAGEVADDREKPAGTVDGAMHSHHDGDGVAAVEAGQAAAATADNAVWRNRSFFGSFGRLLYEQRSLFPSYALMVASAMGASTLAPLQAFLFAKLVVIFGALSVPGLSGDQTSRDGNFYSLMFFVLALGSGISYFGLGYTATHIEHITCAVYRNQYFEAIVQQRVAFFDEEQNSTGTLTNRVGGDPKQLRQLLGSNMSMSVTAFFTIIGSIIISFVYGWKLALLAFSVVVPLVLVSGFLRVRYEAQFEEMNAAVFAESSKWAAESIDAFRTVTSLTLEEVICKRYEELLFEHVRRAFNKARFATLIFALSNSISLACQALVFWYGGHLILNGEYQTMAFFVCYMAAIQGAESAGQSLGFLPNAAQAKSAANRILSIRDTKSIDRVPLSETIPDTDEDVDVQVGNRGARFELQNVHFHYPTRNVPIFRGLSLTIERGQFTAIVGASGSGKTSIISLLERFYDLEQGKILCNGRDITEVNVHKYRKLLSLVAQEPALFQGTVRENVLMGVDDSSVSEEDMVQACHDASIYDFIASLPEGYDTDLGSRGVSLSGGQKQRLAIARALLRNPRVLLLDEATSSLDSDTEKMIQATLERVSRRRTTVAVAHRLSTIQKADVIYVLGDGEVLEKGNHVELLERRGMYWSMCQSQALDR